MSSANSSNKSDKNKMVIDKPNQFPWKLYDMLDTAEKRNEEHIISWIRDGRAFKVHNRDVFIEEYMKKMFNQTKFKSFQRQLNLWGFERVQSGPDKGSYYHPLFVKGHRDCCQRLTRVRLKGATTESKTPASSSKDTNNKGTSQEADKKIPPVGTAGGAAMAMGAIGMSAPGGLAAAASAPPSLWPGVASIATAAPTHGFTGPDPARVSAIEAALRSTSQQQMSDILRYQQGSQQFGSSLASPGISATIAGGTGHGVSSGTLGVPLFNGADRSSLVVNGLLQHEREVEEQEGERSQRPDDIEHQMHNAKPSPQVAPHLQEEQSPSTARDADQEQTQTRASESTGGSGSDHMAALLSVSAQRRREEELALLLELSKPKGVDV